MKIYGCPDEVKWAEPDYANYDHKVEQAREAKHQEALKAWLLKSGYTGKHTGETVNFPMADGAARYMLAEGPRSALIHLPYGDAYHYRDAAFIPKAEIIRRIESSRRWPADAELRKDIERIRAKAEEARS